MPSYYLETSGLFKRYRNERGSDTVAELFDGKQSSERFLTSYFTTVEMEAITTRALRGRMLTLPTYRRVLGRFSLDVDDPLELLDVSNDTMREAAGVAENYALRAPDAIHLAAARLARASGVSDLVYVTSDRELVHAATRDGFPLLDPEDSHSLDALRAYR